MPDDRTPPDTPDGLHFLGALLRTAVGLVLHHARIFALIVLIRLIPFYVLLRLFPIPDPIISALVETAIAVPCVVALVRYAWSIVQREEITPEDAVLGGTASSTLKLLATNLLVLAFLFFGTIGGAAVFFALTFVLSWVTLVTDQVVILEGDMFFDALRRSYALIRPVPKLTLGVIAVFWIPEIVGMVIYRGMEDTLMREVVSRGLAAGIMPFSAMCFTLLYQHLRIAEINRMNPSAGSAGSSTGSGRWSPDDSGDES